MSKNKSELQLGQPVLYCQHKDRDMQVAMVTSMSKSGNPNLHCFGRTGMDVRNDVPYSKEPKQRHWSDFGYKEKQETKKPKVKAKETKKTEPKGKTEETKTTEETKE